MAIYRQKTPRVYPSSSQRSIESHGKAIPSHPSGGPKVRDGLGPHPLVDVLVDRVRALIEGALEEQGAHGDGKGEGRGSAEQKGVQPPTYRRSRHVSPLQK